MATSLSTTVAKECAKRNRKAASLVPPRAQERLRWCGVAEGLCKLIGDVVVWQVGLCVCVCTCSRVPPPSRVTNMCVRASRTLVAHFLVIFFFPSSHLDAHLQDVSGSLRPREIVVLIDVLAFSILLYMNTVRARLTRPQHSRAALVPLGRCLAFSVL